MDLKRDAHHKALLQKKRKAVATTKSHDSTMDDSVELHVQTEDLQGPAVKKQKKIQPPGEDPMNAVHHIHQEVCRRWLFNPLGPTVHPGPGGQTAIGITPATRAIKTRTMACITVDLCPDIVRLLGSYQFSGC